MWKGVIIEESLEDKSLLSLVKIISSRQTTLENESERGVLTFHSVELKDSNLDEFIETAQKSIKDSFYIHICKDSEMIVIFRNKVFRFSSDNLEGLNEAREYGISVGVFKEQMPFEKLIGNPFG